MGKVYQNHILVHNYQEILSSYLTNIRDGEKTKRIILLRTENLPLFADCYTYKLLRFLLAQLVNACRYGILLKIGQLI